MNDDLRVLIQARLDNRDRERAEAVARHREQADEMMERVRRNARISRGKWRLESLSGRLKYAREMRDRAFDAIEHLPIESMGARFWMHEWRMRSAEVHSLEVAVKQAVDDYPELADEFRALIPAVSS